MSQLTHEQRLGIIQASLDANERGDHEEEIRLIRLLPLPAHLAKAAKEMYGKEYLIERGYDLSEANEAFGHGWLDR
jgi:hypothetical protein